MGKCKGLVITDEIPNDESLMTMLRRYRLEKFDSEFEIDIFNQDSQFDYFQIGDMREQEYIITKKGDKVNSEIISNIDFDKCMFDLANGLYCIVDKYHWYDFEKLKSSLGIKSDIEAFERSISSIKDNNKVLTIVTFHV